MNESLPPPNWSPTGNSGEWRWEEQGHVDPNTKQVRACWKFYDDSLGLVTSEHYRKMKATSAKKATSKKWWMKIFKK